MNGEPGWCTWWETSTPPPWRPGSPPRTCGPPNLVPCLMGPAPSRLFGLQRPDRPEASEEHGIVGLPPGCSRTARQALRQVQPVRLHDKLRLVCEVAPSARTFSSPPDRKRRSGGRETAAVGANVGGPTLLCPLGARSARAQGSGAVMPQFRSPDNGQRRRDAGHGAWRPAVSPPDWEARSEVLPRPTG